MSGFAGYPKGHPMTRRIEIGLLMAGLATFTLLYNTQAILPYFARDYSISPAQAALSVSAATAGLAVGLIVAVPISERLGRVRVIRWSLGGAAALGALAAFIDDWSLFLVVRFAMGVVLAGLPATAAVYLREEIAPEYSTSATGLYIFGTTLGGLTGRIASSGAIELMHRLGLTGALGLDASHLALLFTALIGVGCAIACWLLLPESRGFTVHRDSLRELVAKFGRAFRDPVLLGLYLLGALGMGTFVGAFNVLGFRLEAEPYLLSVGTVGLLYLVYPVAGYGGALANRLADRTSLRAVIVFGPVLALAGVGLMAARPLWVIIAGMLVLAVGFSIVHSLASAWVATRANASVGVPAQAASMYMLFYYGGSSVNGNLAPLAWEAGGWPAVTWLIGAMMAAALVIALLLGRSKPVVR
ncbi:MFS transporter [Brevibacterium sp. 5221]|uniref:MFS transporter n=1 Tax=Brevibacterium rongguiense TaxID=2695267 RepID=A0A6N9H5K8_9MICO|nr:MFS transporter [Brevibacterium rongguiense]MYM19199.1 MFS transporter [Brevibacterium rongguiense]